MRTFLAALFTAFVAFWCAHAQAVTCTSSGGNWGTVGIWDCGHVPANGDDVIIAQDTTLNTNTNTLNSLRIDATLMIGNDATSRTLTVAGNISVSGSMILGGSNATHTLVAGGDITNTGTINLRPSATRLCNVTFNRNGNQTVSGAGSFMFNLITLNMGASRSNVLDMQPAITVPSPFLTITNGTYRHSSPTSITPWTADPNIPANGGFWLSSAATVTTTGFNVTVNGGMFRISSGTVNIGTANSIRMILANAATTLLHMDGGVLNVTGGINSASNTAAGTFTMSGGTMTLQTVNAGPNYTLLLGSSTTLNWSGGTIVAVNGNAATDDIDIRSSTQTVTGGTLQIGNNTATSTNQVSYINGAGGQLNVWDLVIGGSGGSQTILMRSSTNVLDDLTIQSGNTLQPNAGLAINVGAGNMSGDWINNGTFTPSTTTVTLTGTGSNQVIGGTTATTFYNLTFNKAANDVTLNTNATASNLLTFTSGDVITGTNTLISSANCATSVSRTSGHVIGNLRLAVPATNPVTCVFHVGDANNYAPITITKTGTNSGTLTGSTTAGDHADTTGGTSGIDSTKSVNRYWTLTGGTLATGTPYSATFQFCSAVGSNCAVNDVDSGANTANFAVARKTSVTWSLTTVGTRTGTTTQATGLASYGEFAVGEVTGSSVNAAGFDCIESSISFSPSPVRHPLYTKLAGTPFVFDVVALNSAGGIETGYVGTGSKIVTVELFDDSASPSPACNAYASPIATQTVTFVAADAGRKTTATFTIGNAYAKLRCRARDAVPVYGCSTDNFTVRPIAFTSVTSTNANADAAGTSTTATPAVKAGSFFNLSAATGLTGYMGTPVIDASLLQWGGVPTGGRAAPGVGAVSGSFPAASSGTSSGSSFSYNEAGYFRFLAQGVYDGTFASASSDISNADCTNDFSNALVGGKYGCKFGNTAATNHFGRFIPDHFTVVTPAAFGAGCGAFTYMAQNFATPLAANIEARTLGNALTQNYSGAFATGTVAAQLENANSGTAIAPSRLMTGGAWSGGVYDFFATSLQRAATVDGPFQTLDIGVTVTGEATLVDRNMDASNTSCITDPSGTSTGTCTAARLQTVDVRYGRFHMANAFGSELLPLSMMARSEYFNGTGWVLNTDDSCTVLATTPTSPQALNPSGSTALTCGGATCTTATPVVAGDLRLQLSAPGTAGFADIGLDVPAWLEFPWISAVPANPSGRATFGVYRGNQRLIYRRERY